MRLLLSILRHARAAFAGRMLWRLAVVIGAATLTGAIAGLLPAVIGRAVSAVAGTDSGAPPAGLSRYIALLMPSGATWSVVVWALAATIITVAIGVLSSKLATSLSGDVTAALRIELMKAVLAALTEGGFEGAERAIGFRTLIAHMIGAVQVEHYGSISGERTRALAAAARGRYPTLGTTTASARHLTDDEVFRRGLESVLVGLESLRGRRRRRARARCHTPLGWETSK